jgi:hypothetical protein
MRLNMVWSYQEYCFQHINDYDIQPSPQDCLNMSAEQIRTYIADHISAILKDECFLQFGKNTTNVCHSLDCISSQY